MSCPLAVSNRVQLPDSGDSKGDASLLLHARVGELMASPLFIFRAHVLSLLRPRRIGGAILFASLVFPLSLGFGQSPDQNLFPGVKPVPIGKTGLVGSPAVVSLERLDPSQMSEADYQVVSNLRAELARQASLANFDISDSGWKFQQVVCPALPDYVLLSFTHGAAENGSSRFGAALPRNNTQVRVISTYAHGLLPFQASWNRQGTFEAFNNILSEERGTLPMSHAPNWLTIALCYAELSGYSVQVLNPTPLPDTTLDTLRLDGNRPQMMIASDQSADILFSDVSHPATTTNWKLHFDRHGQMTSASRMQSKQPAKIALKP
jgi:hypothetical protein